MLLVCAVISYLAAYLLMQSLRQANRLNFKAHKLSFITLKEQQMTELLTFSLEAINSSEVCAVLLAIFCSTSTFQASFAKPQIYSPSLLRLFHHDARSLTSFFLFSIIQYSCIH